MHQTSGRIFEICDANKKNIPFNSYQHFLLPLKINLLLRSRSMKISLVLFDDLANCLFFDAIHY